MANTRGASGDYSIDSLASVFEHGGKIGGDVEETEYVLVSFKDQSLKLNTAADALQICEKIETLNGRMTALELSGNTIGIEAGEAIAKTLQRQPLLKWCIWNDIFRTRLKTQIPITLRSLCAAMMHANVRLVELDLSDNAFGPVGAHAIDTFLRSDSAFSLQTLRLNNDGLGVGGEVIASALIACHASGTKQGRPLRLKTFIAGRNRLENRCAIALAKAFTVLGSLEEVGLPQNGIYHRGVTALCAAFSHNPRLRRINLQDNTFTQRGARQMASVLPKLQDLEVLNLSDCLCRSTGALEILNALKDRHLKLKELDLSGNEIGTSTAQQIIATMAKKPAFTTLGLSVNCYGADFHSMRTMASSSGIAEVDVGEESDDCGSEEEEATADDEDDEVSEEGSADDEEPAEDQPSTPPLPSVTNGVGGRPFNVFMRHPTWANFMMLGTNPFDTIVNELEDEFEDAETVANVIIKIGESLTPDALPTTDTLYVASTCAGRLLVEADKRRTTKLLPTNQICNCLMAYLGFVRAEKSDQEPQRNVTGVLRLLAELLKSNYFASCRDVMRFCFKLKSSRQFNPNALQEVLDSL